MGEITGGVGNDLQKWGYETRFREYARLLGKKGGVGLESIDNYPKGIELGSSWHRILNRMRAETIGDGHERFALIAYNERSVDFDFPEVPFTGEGVKITEEAALAALRQARSETGFAAIVGILHTHKTKHPFSLPDLYSTLSTMSEPQILVSGLATPQENMFLFRTKETLQIVPFQLPYSIFRGYWLEKSGFGENEEGKLMRVEPHADLWRANMGVAHEHRLTIYRGLPDKDLVRAYP